MRIIRALTTILLMLVYAFLPIDSGSDICAPEFSASTVAAMNGSEAMPACPSCLPDDSADAMCLQTCLGVSAIVQDPGVTLRHVAGQRVIAFASRLSGAQAMPEPRPPKTVFLIS
ncbi:hypothetical protein [Hyphomonas sp.]|uniref:hypothetical protein n=1 Tax=Alphaproteobacteria TaxID=28211 RepID=UPI003265054F